MSRYDQNEAVSSLDEMWRRNHSALDQIDELKRKKYVGVWMNPTYLNGWANAGAPYHNYQYRLLFTDTLQDRGVLDGGATGTVAYILPEPWRATDDVAWVGSVLTTGFVPATFSMDASTGEVTITF